MSENEKNEIQVADPSAPVRNDYDFNLTDPNKMSVGNILALAKLAARGGMSDPKGAEGLAIRAVFAIQMGFSPVEGMQGLHMIEGKPVVGAQLLGAGIRRSGRYDYKVVEHDATKCVLEGFRIVNGERESLGLASFTIAEAQSAGLSGKAIWQKYPQNMLYARAMANLYRWHMPDLIGMPFYTEGEDPEPDAPAEPTVVEKAAAAAMERAAKGRKKEPEPKPDNVIEAEFVPAGTVAKDDQAQVQVPVSEPQGEPVIIIAAEETETVAHMAENPISAGQFDPLDDTAPQNRFALVEGWDEPEPIENFTPDMGVIGYHHVLKKSADGKMWQVVDRETDTPLEKIQVTTGKDDLWAYILSALTDADKFFRAKDPALKKACEGEPPLCHVAKAVLALRQAKASAPKEEETAEPGLPAAFKEEPAGEGLTVDALTEKIGKAAVDYMVKACQKKGRSLDGFLPTAQSVLDRSDGLDKDQSANAVAGAFMTWSNQKES